MLPKPYVVDWILEVGPWYPKPSPHSSRQKSWWQSLLGVWYAPSGLYMVETACLLKPVTPSYTANCRKGCNMTSREDQLYLGCRHTRNCVLLPKMRRSIWLNSKSGSITRSQYPSQCSIPTGSQLNTREEIRPPRGIHQGSKHHQYPRQDSAVSVISLGTLHKTESKGRPPLNRQRSASAKQVQANQSAGVPTASQERPNLMEFL